MAPKFSAYPFARLRKLSRRDAEVESTIARWIAARPHGERLAKLVAGRRGAAPRVGGDARVGGDGVGRDARLGGDARVEVVAPTSAFDPFAARCEVRVGGAAIEVRGSSAAVRTIAQRLLPGPDELAAPRPLTIVERSMWALVVATALEDLGVPGEVWPLLVDDETTSSTDAKTRAARPNKSDRAVKKDKRADKAEDKRADKAEDKRADKAEDKRADDNLDDKLVVELAVTVGDLALAVQLRAPAELRLRVPPARPWPAWFATTHVDAAIVLGRCALDRRSLDRLALRSVITLDRPLGSTAKPGASPREMAAELDVLGGSIGLRAPAGTLEAVVATEYVPRDMSLPDDAHVELTVALGTTRLSLRQLGELAVGQIVQLGRPLAGPFELRAAGRVLGRGELVDVDGELAVRIVSLGDQEL